MKSPEDLERALNEDDLKLAELARRELRRLGYEVRPITPKELRDEVATSREDPPDPFCSRQPSPLGGESR